MFHDWNGNGRKDDAFDNLMDWHIMNEATKRNNGGGGGGNNGGCCGGLFMLLLVTIPLWAPVALILSAAGVIDI